MTPALLKQQIRQITVWSRGSERAPHKPLLLLYALGKLVNDDQRLIPFVDVDRDVGALLREFGPQRKSCHPEYPFWRLQNDGVWELTNTESVISRHGHSDAKKSELVKHAVSGGFTPEIFELLRSDQNLVSEVALEILSQHFPPTYFEDILSCVGLDIQLQQPTRRRRDPAFRDRILVAYEFRCAICGYDLRIGNQHVGLEAAHIKWHVAGGPDIETNGLALCSLHHKLFDLGAISISDQFALHISQRAHGSTGFHEWLMTFHGRPLRAPQAQIYLPEPQYLKWHRDEVFHGPV
ncbi:MAG: HNH endonuclease, partial [Planctomycetes bacterium]|nr:HNH endonuclease [Planctomycetota bacterium]